MQQVIILQRENEKIIDGAFWGFNPTDGIDIEDNVRYADESIRQKSRLLYASDYPYAEGLYLCGKKYKWIKCCQRDKITDDENIYFDSDDYDVCSFHRDDSLALLRHIEKTLVLSGRVDLCGGNNPNTIVPCDVFLIQEKIKTELSKTGFTGFSFFDTVIAPNQTGITRPVIYGINTHQIIDCNRINIIANKDSIETCPRCSYTPLICPECRRITNICPNCKKQVFYTTPPYIYSDPRGRFYNHRILRFLLTIRKKLYKWLHILDKGFYSYSLDERIDSHKKTSDAMFEFVYDDTTRNKNILPGELWQGDDLFEVIEAANSRYVMTKPLLDWFEKNQFGPLLAYPFQVDVSLCSPEQKDAIMKLLR